ncbi:cytochrome-c oxidase [Sorangium cellulosum]|uniref:Cytochrome-c oxidase n=1 Tax=Sorangium cellulosum TaxID=56 RepID=A0A2L0EIU6_SORCE|nr:cytochrome c [Sorangium cellulosum]AUX39216.1 cytochrome-c oxidase [Sorangium cellulosum]
MRCSPILAALPLLAAACKGSAPADEGVALSPRAAQGKALFSTLCASCHAPSAKLVGPPLSEMAGLYATDPEGIVRWAVNPGRKRTDVPPMPSFRGVRESDLADVAQYIIEAGTAAGKQRP